MKLFLQSNPTDIRSLADSLEIRLWIETAMLECVTRLFQKQLLKDPTIVQLRHGNNLDTTSRYYTDEKLRTFQGRLTGSAVKIPLTIDFLEELSAEVSTNYSGIQVRAQRHYWFEPDVPGVASVVKIKKKIDQCFYGHGIALSTPRMLSSTLKRLTETRVLSDLASLGQTVPAAQQALVFFETLEELVHETYEVGILCHPNSMATDIFEDLAG